MGNYEKISITRENNAATITINNPPLNILTLKVMDELTDALNELLSDENIRIVVLKSAGNTCSAGADVKEHLPETANDLINKFGSLIKLLINYQKPTICVIRGKCLGGGMELFLSCDFVIASKNAEIGVPEIKLAAIPPIAIALLPKVVGLHRAYEMILLGNSITADKAAELGLINYVVDDSEIDGFIKKLTDELLSKSQVALNIAKRAILGSYMLGVNDAIDYASRLYLNELVNTHDYTEGLRSFLEKRKPIFIHK